MRLHTVNQSPGTGSALASCLRIIDGKDCLLLLEDGVYAARAGQADTLLEAGCKICVLEADAAARGLLQLLEPGVELVDYADFVALAAECDSVQSWY
jgi:tRNA 2-thiouridine synthesizing protein B